MSRVETINRILRNLQATSPSVEASALISEDGLMLASALPQHVDESRVAGVSATLSTLGRAPRASWSAATSRRCWSAAATATR